MTLTANVLALMFLLLGLGGLPSHEQSGIRHLNFEHLSIEQGLSQNSIHSILQDRQGFMWFATEDGLDRYDGYGFQVYKHAPDNPASLSNNLVDTLYEDAEGQLWLGTYAGLDRIDQRTGNFAHFGGDSQDPTSLRGSVVQSIVEDHAGTLWVGTEDGGLNRLDRGANQFVHYLHVAGDSTTLSSNDVLSVYEDREGALWVGTSAGLDRLDRASRGFVHFHEGGGTQPGLNQSMVNAILETHDGSLWVATQSGVFQLDVSRNQVGHYLHNPNDPTSLADDSVRTIFEDKAGDLWFGTREGLDLLDQGLGSLVHYRHDPNDPGSLSSDSIQSIYEDKSGVLWVGSSGGGLSKVSLSSRKFESYQLHPGLPNTLSDNNVWAILEDHRGELWLGTFYAGLNRLDRLTGEVSVFTHKSDDPNSLSSNEVRAVLEDRDGTLWVGTEHGGLDRFDPMTGGFVHYRHDPANPASLSDESIFALLEDTQGRLWIGTEHGGLDLFDRGTGGFIHHQHDPSNPKSLSDGGVRAIYEDGKGILWVGTLGGLNAWDESDKGFTHYAQLPQDQNSLSNDQVISLAGTPDGGIWVGTFGGGLNRFNPLARDFTHYTTKDGLPDDTVYGVIADGQGFLWLSTNRGLSRFDPRTGSFRNYDVNDGLQSDQFNIGAHYRSPDGELFFGGASGFDYFFPEQVKDNLTPPPIAITAVKVSNRSVSTNPVQNEEIHLSYRDYAISFEFAAMDYNAPAKNQYAYRLDGVDPDWVFAGTRRYASYTNLAGGTYTFRVRASNGDGVWATDPFSIRIVVTPPFWETWWFATVAVLAIAGGATVGYRIRMHGIEVQHQALEAQVQRRTKELAALNTIAEVVSRSLDLKDILHDALDKMMEVTDTESGAAYRLEVEPEEPLLFTSPDDRHLDDEARDTRVPIAAPAHVARPYGSDLRLLTYRGFSEKSIQALRDLHGHDEALAAAARHAQPVAWSVEYLPGDRGSDGERVAQVVTVPLVAKGKVVGAVDLGTSRTRIFPAELLSLLAAVGRQIGLAVENASLYEQAEQSAALAERTRLARELHDSVTQSLYSMTLYAEAGARSLTSGKAQEAADLLRQLRDTALEALREMRLLIFQLRPPVLEKTGLANALRARLEAVEARGGILTELIVEGAQSAGLPSLVVQQELYRIAQEALNNVLKHAHAQHVRVRMSISNESTSLEISDDGVGFERSARRESGGLGLAGMKERAEKLGGILDISSEPGKGTRLSVQVPVGPVRSSQIAAKDPGGPTDSDTPLPVD
jgi:ligand-binding sensor domain-containing protein/nitrate/nitrite-specific signal transduction histidine kinase